MNFRDNEMSVPADLKKSYQNIHGMIGQRLLRVLSVSSTKRFYADMSGPIEAAIRETLTTNLKPVHLEIVNESYMHNVPKGSESHFKVLIVSEMFENVPLIKRHRMVNELVKTKLDGEFVHALSIEPKTPKQWDPTYEVKPSPNCLGGFGK